MIEKLADETFTLYTINYATKLISSTIDLDELLNIAIETLIEIAQVEKGSLMLIDKDDSALIVKVVKDKKGIEYPQRRLKVKGGILREVINEGKIYFANNLKEFNDLGDGLGGSVISILSLPLMGKEKVIGIVNLYNPFYNKEFTQDDVNIISTLVTQVGANIENARLYKELEEWAKELELRVAERTKELNEANGELRKINQAKSDFLSTAAHELKTPLTSIKAIALTLLGNPDEEVSTRAEFLSLIDSEVDRLTRLINNILNLSKIEAGKIEWNMKEISLLEVVNVSVTNIKPLAAQKKIEIKMEAEDNLPTIIGDYEKLMQVVINLLSNALKFIPEKGEIKVKIGQKHQPEKILQVSISDTGTGIAREDLDKVFDKFKQVGSQKIQGTGLGLTICREIIGHHSGKIWVESELGMGSTFHFTIPVNTCNYLPK